jgi:hypothetical protein
MSARTVSSLLTPLPKGDEAVLAVHSFSFTNASRRDLKSDASINRIKRAVRDFTDWSARRSGGKKSRINSRV